MALEKIIDCNYNAEYTEDLTDMVLVVDGNEIRVHRLILALRSEYFKIMFYGEFAESKKDRIEINDINWQPFKTLIDYIYTGKLIAKADEAPEIYSVAHMLRLFNATYKLHDFMKTKLNDNNFIKYINCAYQFCLPDLKEAALKLWCEDYYKLKDNQITKLSEDAILGLLTCEKPQQKKSYKETVHPKYGTYEHEYGEEEDGEEEYGEEEYAEQYEPKPNYELVKFNSAHKWLLANDSSKAQILMDTIDVSKLTTNHIKEIRHLGYFSDTKLLLAMLKISE